MKKVSKNKCSLEDEYKFEHLSRIKAEKYIEEIWEYACKLQKEVSRLQKIITSKNIKVEENTSSNALRLEKLLVDRQIAMNKWRYNGKNKKY